MPARTNGPPGSDLWDKLSPLGNSFYSATLRLRRVFVRVYKPCSQSPFSPTSMRLSPKNANSSRLLVALGMKTKLLVLEKPAILQDKFGLRSPSAFDTGPKLVRGKSFYPLGIGMHVGFITWFAIYQNTAFASHLQT